MRDDQKVKISLVCAGTMLSLFTYLMVHQVSSAMPHWEIAAFVFNFAYFTGVSCGYFISRRVSPRAYPYLFPVTLLLQALFLIFASPLFFISETTALNLFAPWLGVSFARFAAYAFFFFLLLGLGTPLFALVLPRAIQSGGPRALTLRSAYSWEIIGSLFGLAILPLVPHFGQIALVAAYAVSFGLLVWSLTLPPKIVGLTGLLALALVLSFNPADRLVGTWFYQMKSPSRRIASLADVRYTPYHKIEILETEAKDKFLYLSGKRQFGEGSHHVYSYFVSEFPARLLNKPRVLVLGCGAMSTVGRIGKLAAHIQIVDIDPVVFELSKKHFPQFNHLAEFSNWNFTADDAKHYLANEPGQFDLIVHDIPPANSRQIALTYTQEFFQLAKARLAPGGIFSISALDTAENKTEYGKRVLSTLQSVFEDVTAFRYGGSLYTYSGEKLSVRGAEAFKRTFHEFLSAQEKAEWFRGDPEILLNDDIKRMASGNRPVTNNNTGDLVF